MLSVVVTKTIGNMFFHVRKQYLWWSDDDNRLTSILIIITMMILMISDTTIHTVVINWLHYHHQHFINPSIDYLYDTVYRYRIKKNNAYFNIRKSMIKWSIESLRKTWKKILCILFVGKQNDQQKNQDTVYVSCQETKQNKILIFFHRKKFE